MINTKDEHEIFLRNFWFHGPILNSLRSYWREYIWICFPLYQFDKEISAIQLTHWGRVMHICVSRLTITGSDNGLLPGRHQAIIWTNAGILLIWTLGTNISEILGKIHSFSFKKMNFKMSSAKGRLFSLGLNELKLHVHLFLRVLIISPYWFRWFLVPY